MHEYTDEATALLALLREKAEAAPSFEAEVAISEAREAVEFALADIEDKAVLRYRGQLAGHMHEWGTATVIEWEEREASIIANTAATRRARVIIQPCACGETRTSTLT